MISQQRLTTLIEEAAKTCGSQAALARRLGVRPSAVTEWLKGRAGPNWSHLVQMQDIAKRAACVLLTWAALTLPDPAQAALNVTPVAHSSFAKCLAGIHIVRLSNYRTGVPPRALTPDAVNKPRTRYQ
jgi:hypothetical protein